MCVESIARVSHASIERRTTVVRMLTLACVLATAGSLSASVSAELTGSQAQASAPETATLTVDWAKVLRTSRTTATLQVVVNPPLRRGGSIHDQAFKAVKDLGCDYVRYVPWLPYPRLGVPALEPPANGRTSWDFSLIDPMTLDFLDAQAGHSVVLNFSTAPAWLFKTDKPVTYPADPDQPVWDYTQGTELRDPTGKELGDYYARLVSWYTQGGFTDEFGKRHESGHRRKIDYWEVLNSGPRAPAHPGKIHRLVRRGRVCRPQGVAGDEVRRHLAGAAGRCAGVLRVLLNPKNHRAGIPLDAISYHFYAVPALDHTPQIQQFTFFEQADKFLDTVRYIETIRKRLSPDTITMINEIGSISADDLLQSQPGHVTEPIPDSYWNLSGALYRYLFSELGQIGIDVAGESQLVGYPTQFPSVTMVDWRDGRPNARYWVLKLLHDNFGPGDKLVEAKVTLPGNQSYVHARAYVTRDGKRKVLLVNKRARPFDVILPGGVVRIEMVDQATGFNPPATREAASGRLALPGFGVAVVTLQVITADPDASARNPVNVF